MGKHTLYRGNILERIKEIPDNSVHLTVTSPPYYNAKEYHSEEVNVGNNASYEDYLNKIWDIVTELQRITVPGGIVVWNTSPVIYEGKRFMLPQDSHVIFESSGFTCRDDITWAKPDGAAKLRCGGWVQNKGKPLTWHPNIVDEKVMVYVKPGERPEGEYDNISKYYPVRPKDLLTNIWYIQPETATTWHDAPFPEELVQRCILLYTFKGETVLDPFLGSGTTMKVARDLGRDSIGIELSDEYIQKAKRKLGWGQQSLTGSHEYEEK